MQASATFKTEQASRYLKTLCDHFGGQASGAKPPFDAYIELQFGHCHLAQRDGLLELRVEAKDRAHLAQLVELMTRYVERVAFRENPRLLWHTAPDDIAQKDEPTETNTRA